MRVEKTNLLVIIGFFLIWVPLFNAQLPGLSTRSLDALLQDNAFMAFGAHPKTGIPYESHHIPRNLTGIQVSALRLRSGSLRTRGVHSFKEFQIPVGVVEQPYVERLALVYHNLGNWSNSFYPLPGFSYLAPVLGLIAYNASDLSASNVPELSLRASDKPILVKFPDLKLGPDGVSPKCVYFDLHGSLQFDNVLPGNVCSAIQQGHFSIVVESIAPSPAPGVEVVPPIADKTAKNGGKDQSKVWRVFGSLLGGFILLGLLGLLAVWLRRFKHGKKVQQMEWVADRGETLQITTLGNAKAPLAMGTRTRPVLENEYVP
ncbi:hypothetical protein ACB098_08G074700 [Castanea mollissima]|uniref:Uncharacterized protein n=1 Tax=Castanea mollissima TaxID=60419 RepID=A0A8J4RWM8_9ROSI|nr:hypothetical protein CMV_000749 [Castanea mollissima]